MYFLKYTSGNIKTRKQRWENQCDLRAKNLPYGSDYIYNTLMRIRCRICLKPATNRSSALLFDRAGN